MALTDGAPRVSESARVPIRKMEAAVRVRGEETAGSLAVVEQTLPPGMVAMPVHTHTRETETLHVLEGVLTVKASGRLVRVGAGSILALPPGVPHTFWNDGARPARFVAMYSPAGLERWHQEVSALIPATGTVQMREVLELSGRYGVEFDMGSLLDIIERYNVQLV